jgi:peptide deformylase
MDELGNLFYYYEFTYTKKWLKSKYYKQDSTFVGSHTTRFAKGKKIAKITYYDENDEMKVKKIDNKEEAALFGRKLDYLFNTTLIDRLPPHNRDQAIKALAGKGAMPGTSDAFCPPPSKKVYFVSVADKLLFFMFVSLLLPLFNLSEATLSGWYLYDKIAFVLITLLMVGFFLFANYEAKKYKQCTSCQVGNNIGVIIKRMVANIAFTTAAFFILG